MITELEIKHKAKKKAIQRILKPPALYLLLFLISTGLIFLVGGSFYYGRAPKFFDFCFLFCILSIIVYFFWYRHYKKEEIVNIKIQIEKEVKESI